MKNTRLLLRAMCAFVLCCAMLTGAALAADPVQVYQINGTTITFGGTPPTIMPRAGSEIFVDDIITTSSTYNITRACHPANGNFLSFTIYNEGDTDIKIDLVLDVDGERVTDSKVLTPQSGHYYSSVDSNSSEGLDCQFDLTISPRNKGEEITFDACVQQYNR